jgi:hypothetical protein
MPHPLADKRSLEVRVRGLARIVERLGELERALDVLARGLEIVERVPLRSRPTDENIAYLRAKQEKMGHLLEIEDEGLGRS